MSVCLMCLFVFKQKTAYEMRISDWSSDLCSSDLPRQIGDATGFVAVSSGKGTVVALKSDGTIWAWGGNIQGQLGQGTSGWGTDSATPLQVGTDTDWVSVNANYGSLHAIKADGSLWAWGQNTSGQLGVGDKVQRSEEHTSELQSLMRISYAVFCLKKKK